MRCVCSTVPHFTSLCGLYEESIVILNKFNVEVSAEILLAQSIVIRTVSDYVVAVVTIVAVD